MIEPLAISVTEAARALGIGRTLAYALIAEGRLETVRFGRRRTLVKMASVRALIDQA